MGDISDLATLVLMCKIRTFGEKKRYKSDAMYKLSHLYGGNRKL